MKTGNRKSQMTKSASNNTIQRIFTNPDHVCDYENKTRRSNWLGPEIMFGLTFQHVQAGDKLLDLGIGTGLCSEMFHKAGLMIYGIDFSPEMLKVCRDKNISAELKEHNLCNTPYPFSDNSMDHAVCGGVLHIIPDIAPLFREVSRITRPGGIFSFCDMGTGHQVSDHVNNGDTAIRLHSHGWNTIAEQLETYHFELLKSLTFEVFVQNKPKGFTAYAIRNTKLVQ